MEPRPGCRPQLCEGASLLKAEHPHHAELIDAYGARFDEMMPGRSPDRSKSSPNYSSAARRLRAQQFFGGNLSTALRRFDFSLVRGTLISGDIGMLKPEPGIYRALLDRFCDRPANRNLYRRCSVNAAGADKVGIHGVHFKTRPRCERSWCVLGSFDGPDGGFRSRKIAGR